MIIKPRSESEELMLLRYLNVRMELSVKDLNYYSNLEKGFEGEKQFDARTKNLPDDHWHVLNDLLLEWNNSLFQIDSTLITGNTIHLFNVKNYDGDHYVNNGRWYRISGHEIKDPLLQLQRSESLLRQLIRNLGYHFKFKADLVFVNPHFHLYQAPMDLPIIFPAQLERFMNRLEKNSSLLTKKHTEFAQRLSSLHINESPYIQRPDYSFDQLRKGITCVSCNSLNTFFPDRIVICKTCGSRENVETSVLRSVDEFKFLFPNIPITTNIIFEWCKIIRSRKIIWRILSKNFKLVGNNKSSHYI